MYCCSNCGEKIEEYRRYCPHCNYRVCSKDDYDKKMEELRAFEDGLRKNTIILILFLIGLLIGLIAQNTPHVAQNISIPDRTYYIVLIGVSLAGIAFCVRHFVLSDVAESRKKYFDKLAYFAEKSESVPTKLSDEDSRTKINVKVEVDYEIYVYQENNACDRWICEFCDTENQEKEERCLVCGYVRASV